MPTPLPDRDSMLLSRRTRRGPVPRPRHRQRDLTGRGLSPLQRVLVEATAESLTGYRVTIDVEPIDAGEFAAGLARRTAWFRNRILQKMILGALVLRPIPPRGVRPPRRFADELSVGDDMLAITHDLADGSFGLAAIDFDRAGYTRDWAARPTTRCTRRPTSPRRGSCRCTTTRWPTGGERSRTCRRARSAGASPSSTGPAGSTTRAPPARRRRCWPSTTGCTSSPTTARRSSPSSRCSRSSPRPTPTHAASASWRWWSRCSRPARCRPAPGVFEAFPASCRTTASRSGVADALRRGSMVEGGVDFLRRRLVRARPPPGRGGARALRRHREVRPRGRGRLGRAVGARRPLRVPGGRRAASRRSCSSAPG